jgi:hypothetical protein
MPPTPVSKVEKPPTTNESDQPETERETERDRERQRETERDRDRYRQIERETERQRGRHTEISPLQDLDHFTHVEFISFLLNIFL